MSASTSRPLGALAALSAATLLACAPPADPALAEAEIFGGRPATLSEVHGTVAVRWGSSLCSGTLIAPDLVVSAAHCVTDTDPSTGTRLRDAAPEEVVVVAGALSIATALEDQLYAVARVAVHPSYPVAPLGDLEYLGLSRLDDIALLELEVPIETMAPIPLLPADQLDARLPVGAPLIIAGYGRVDPELGGAAGTLFIAETFMVERVARELRVGGPSGTSQCHGDSGGPTYVDVEGALYLVGIASRVDIEHETFCREGTVSTLAPAYADWIARRGARVTVCSAGPGPGTGVPAWLSLTLIALAWIAWRQRAPAP